MPGNQGGSNWGSTAGNPADGSVYVIGFNVPTIIRLLQARRDAAGRAAGRRRVVKEGRYVTDGFGLYPTIVNPPYTTLTAYDLNQGTIKWQIGLGDDLRLVGQGIKGTGTAATTKGGIIADRARACCSSRPPTARSTSTTARPASELSELPLGGPTSGSPSMYELGGRQYLLVTARRRSRGAEAPWPRRTEGPRASSRTRCRADHRPRRRMKGELRERAHYEKSFRGG